MSGQFDSGSFAALTPAKRERCDTVSDAIPARLLPEWSRSGVCQGYASLELRERSSTTKHTAVCDVTTNHPAERKNRVADSASTRREFKTLPCRGLVLALLVAVWVKVLVMPPNLLAENLIMRIDEGIMSVFFCSREQPERLPPAFPTPNQ